MITQGIFLYGEDYRYDVFIVIVVVESAEYYSILLSRIVNKLSYRLWGMSKALTLDNRKSSTTFLAA